MQRNRNLIEFYTYDQVMQIYKQRKRENRLRQLNNIINWMTSNRVKHIAGGIVLIIFLLIMSLLIKDPTALAFLSPICLGFMFIDEEK